MKANSSKVDTSKILLIILGVIAAIVIGFSSKAIGSNNSLQIPNSSKIEFERKVDKVFKKSSAQLSKSVLEFFAHK